MNLATLHELLNAITLHGTINSTFVYMRFFQQKFSNIFTHSFIYLYFLFLTHHRYFLHSCWISKSFSNIFPPSIFLWIQKKCFLIIVCQRNISGKSKAFLRTILKKRRKNPDIFRLRGEALFSRHIFSCNQENRFLNPSKLKAVWS